MSCRETPSGSAFTSYSRIINGIPQPANLSMFHALRDEYNSVPNPGADLRYRTSTEAYRRYVAETTDMVRADQTITDARRASLLARLEEAATTDQIPDEATIYALSQIHAHMRSQGQARTRFLNDYIAATGATPEEAAQRFRDLENGIDRGRSRPDPATYTPENILAATNAGLGRERGTVHAFATLRAEAEAARAAALNARPARTTVTPYTDNSASAGAELGMRVVGLGYDDRTGHLDVEIEDTATGQRSIRSYRSVQTWTYRDMADGRATSIWAGSLRGRYRHRYPTQEAAEQGRRAPRCAACGQWSTVGHSCPVELVGPLATFPLNGYRTRTSRQQVELGPDPVTGDYATTTASVQLPLVAQLRTAAGEGSVLLERVAQWVFVSGHGHGRVTGEFALVRDPSTGEVTVNNQLRCDCGRFITSGESGTCRHIEAFAQAVEHRINPPSRRRAPRTEAERVAAAAAAQAAMEAAAAADWTRDQEAFAEARRTWNAQAEVSYSQDPAAFEADWAAAQEALARREAGDTRAVVPYLRENALGGMAAPGSGQAFAPELEYDFPAGWTYEQRAAANQAIAQQLYDAGLTGEPRMMGYHYSHRRGFRDTHTEPDGTGTWVLESDGSVAGELVPPAMYDTPETWEKLETACRILRDNGAIASTKVGAHVHVGTGFYNGDPAKYYELANLMNQHEDVMFRLAQNPERGKHRQGTYTRTTNETPITGFSDMGDVRGWQGYERTVALNLGHARGEASDHPEFRIFDGTLDPATIQAQIRLSVAMTHAAARIADSGGTNRSKEPLGAHAARARAAGRRTRALTGEELLEDTATFRSFMDTLFTRRIDKAAMTALFASTKWVTPTKSNQDRAAGDRNALHRRAARAAGRASGQGA